MAGLRQFLVLHEPEGACRLRLAARGMPTEVAAEVAFYLAQATDFAGMLEEIGAALAGVGVELVWAAVDDRDRRLAPLLGPARETTFLWCLTDGFAWYRGSFASAAAALLDVAQFGSPPELQLMAQDKFRTSAAAAAFGLPVPATLLLEDGEILGRIGEPPATGPWFVKPNTLGAKLGIGRDSRVPTAEAALGPAARIRERYGDRALAQAYVAGRDVRVSCMDLGGAGPPPLGVYAVRTDGNEDFPTLEDSLRMTRLREAGTEAGLAVALEDLGGTDEGREIATLARRLARGLGMRDYWSMDFRLDEAGRPWFLELEVCPAGTIYDFLTYLRRAYGLGLADALARAAPVAFGRRRAAPPKRERQA